jgi:membrane-associated phospholipid phosphatase
VTVISGTILGALCALALIGSYRRFFRRPAPPPGL